MPLAQDTYEVSFRGNGYTSQDKVQKMALLRAAELTLEKGYKSFEIVDGGFGTETQVAGFIPGQSNTNVSAYGYGNYASAYGTTTHTPATPLYARKSSGSIIVKMHKGLKKNALVAQTIYDEIYPTVAKQQKSDP